MFSNMSFSVFKKNMADKIRWVNLESDKIMAFYIS